MLRLFTLLLLLSVLHSCAKDAEDIQFEQISTNTSEDISSISIYNNQLIAVGGEVFHRGIVLTGKDLIWTALDSFSNKRLFGIDCNEAHCISVGENGYYYIYTEENGWSFVRLPFWNFQRSTSTTAKHTVTVSGKSFEDGYIYHITPLHALDTIISLEAQLQDVAAVNDDTFIAVGYGTILRTIDGGYNWSHIDQEGDFYHSVDFVDGQNGIIVGQAGSILLTDDGGMTWNTIKNPSSLSANRAQFLSVKYINTNTLYIVGDEGLLWRSTDAGHSWDAFQVNTNHNLNDLTELDGKLYIVGDDGYIAVRPL